MCKCSKSTSCRIVGGLACGSPRFSWPPVPWDERPAGGPRWASCVRSLGGRNGGRGFNGQWINGDGSKPYPPSEPQVIAGIYGCE